MYIKILDNCSGCGACEALNNEVFEVDYKAHVREDKIKANKQDCIDAALICPENAIWIDIM